ncbi:B-cell receptor-associated protein 31 [Nymphon striatum]|nr:B-cell receptor-associated protein 31 [Nymphon striatum]
MQGSGWVQALVQAEIATAGSADSFIRASHVLRTRRAHQVTAAALYILQHRAYSHYCLGQTRDAEDLSEFESWCCQRGKDIPPFHYWATMLELELWSKIFKSRFLRSIEAQSSIYFYGILGLLVLAFLDSIREMQKYSGENGPEEHTHLDAQMQLHMKLFRAQRNFYIAGFTLFLFLVIKRMVSLISLQASLHACNEASMKQAQNATSTAQRLMDERENIKKPQKENEGNVELEKKETELKLLQEETSRLKNELKSVQADRNSMKSQAESVTNEYDRLMTENQKLQDEIDQLKGTDKKSD